MLKRKYVVLSLLTLVSILLGGLFYSNMVKANATVTGYVSVPAAAFVPQYNTYWDASNWGNKLCNDENTNLTLNFYGSVQLPNGATLTKVTSYWHDMGPDDIGCLLKRYSQTQDQELLNVSSSGDSGLGSTTIGTDIVVNNTQYAYYLEVGIPGEQNGHGLYYFQYVIIEYTLPTELVGGLWIPVDKLSVLAPYIALVSVIILAISASVVYIKYRKKQ